MDKMTEVEQVLDKYVRPSLKEHGGDIQVTGLEDGKLHVRYTGACDGCPSVHVTTQELVREEILSHMEGIEDVVLDVPVDESMMEMARRILRGEKP